MTKQCNLFVGFKGHIYGTLLHAGLKLQQKYTANKPKSILYSLDKGYLLQLKELWYEL